MAVAGRSNDEFVCEGNTAVELALVRKPEDLEDDNSLFNPSMCHQVFGAQETIYGYKNLRISLYFTAGFLKPYLAITYDKVVPKKGNEVEADDIEKILREKLQIEFTRSLDEFTRLLTEEDKFKPMGTLKTTFKVDDRSYVIYKGKISTPGLIAYHERIQTFLLWFVDGASFIDTDDEKWQFFFVYEKYLGASGEECHAVAGYATIYEYYAYPQHIRPRISQMVVFPPFQRQGLGAELIQAIYSHYLMRKSMIKDITVEDPSEELQSVRDFVDCQLLLKSDELKDTSGPLTLDIVNKAAELININKKQARRVYEILRLSRVNRENEEEYKAYRTEVKSRLNAPHHCELAKLKKLEKAFPKEATELKNSLVLSEETRLTNLSTMYKELETQYDRVIARLNANVQ